MEPRKQIERHLWAKCGHPILDQYGPDPIDEKWKRIATLLFQPLQKFLNELRSEVRTNIEEDL